jgi:DNA-binding NtrC family response regulator
MTDRHTILIVDDEENIRSALVRALMDEPYEILTASSAEEALALLASTPCTVVLTDERMPGMDGATFLGIVRNRWPETVRMMLTGHASVESTMRAVNTGEIYRFFIKPWDDLLLKLAIRSAIEKHDLEEENRRLLRTVKRQSRIMKSLEMHQPGITDLRRTRDGAYILPEISDDEVREIIALCNDEGSE